jgi:hypothetical protein
MPRKKKEASVPEVKGSEKVEILCFKCMHVISEEHPVKDGNHFCSIECVT